jgi:hypothetical protein
MLERKSNGLSTNGGPAASKIQTDPPPNIVTGATNRAVGAVEGET